jgi:DNA-binding NarL/FixJ family response regulator
VHRGGLEERKVQRALQAVGTDPYDADRSRRKSESPNMETNRVWNGSRLPDWAEPVSSQHIVVLAEGKASDQIALLLGVNLQTVDAHRRRLMEKLGIDNLPGLTRYAIRESLTSLDL